MNLYQVAIIDRKGGGMMTVHPSLPFYVDRQEAIRIARIYNRDPKNRDEWTVMEISITLIDPEELKEERR